MAHVPIVDDIFDRADTVVGAAGSTTGVGNGWIDRAGSRFSIEGGKLRCVSGAFTALLARPMSEARLNQGIDLYVPGGAELTAGPIAYVAVRVQATNNYYLAGLLTSGIRIFKVVAGVAISIKTISFTRNSAHDWLVSLQAFESDTPGQTVVTATATDLTDSVTHTNIIVDDEAVLQQPGSWGVAYAGGTVLHYSRVVAWKSVTLTPSVSLIRRLATKPVTVLGDNVDFTGVELVLSGGTGASIVSQAVISSTQIDLVIAAGTAEDTLTLTDPVSNGTCTIEVQNPTIRPTPVQVLPGTSSLISLTGILTDDAWVAGPADLSLVSGPAGAVLSAAAFSGPNAGSFQLALGSLEETPVVVEDAATAAQFTIRVAHTALITHPAIYLSPDGWELLYAEDGTPTARTRDHGAYLKTKFTGTLASLGVDVSALVGENSAHYPIVHYVIDQRAEVRVQLTSGQTALALASGLPAGTHTLQLWYEIGDFDVNAWEPPLVSVLALTGLTIDAGSDLAAPSLYSQTATLYGDSIGAGTKQAASTDLSRNNPRTSALVLVAGLLGCEYAHKGMPGAGWIKGGQGLVSEFHVPRNVNLQSWRYLYAGAPDLSGGIPAAQYDYLINNYGRNDGASGLTNAAIAASVADWLVRIRAEQPAARIVIVPPFSAQGSTGVNNGVATYLAAHPSDVDVLLITPGADWPNGLLSENGSSATSQSADGIHPLARRNAELALPIATQIQAYWELALTPALPRSAGSMFSSSIRGAL